MPFVRSLFLSRYNIFFSFCLLTIFLIKDKTVKFLEVVDSLIYQHILEIWAPKSLSESFCGIFDRVVDLRQATRVRSLNAENFVFINCLIFSFK